MGASHGHFTKGELQEYADLTYFSKNEILQDRICEVFSSSGDGTLIFEDFLDMMSAFSDLAPKSVKVGWAFKIYDFNDDNSLDYEDLENVVSRLTGDSGQLTTAEMRQLLENLMREADMDDDKKLSLAEFEHVIARCPDFMSAWEMDRFCGVQLNHTYEPGKQFIGFLVGYSAK